jgi:putative DNA primase/helicase
MFSLPQFINWRVEPPDVAGAKPKKVPFDLARGQRIDPQNPANWLRFEDARGRDPAHVGIVLTANDPYFCIDLDHHWDGAKWSPVVMDMLARFPGAYTEVSYSGDGIHLFGRATAPTDRKTKNPVYGLELYDQLRFIAWTGKHAQGSPDVDCQAALDAMAALYLPMRDGSNVATAWTTTHDPSSEPVADDQELIKKMVTARQSAAVAFGGRASAPDLFYGVASALADSWPDGQGGYDASAADSALASHFAFWTGKNCERIERLMRMSALRRDKWDRRGDNYLHRTILGACAKVSSVYKPPPKPDRQPAPVATPGLSTISPDVMVYDFAYTEDELARSLAKEVVNRARYIAAWSTWYIYDDTRWRADSTLALYDLARKTCSHVADTVKVDPQFTEQQRNRIVAHLKSANTISAVERIARSDRGLVASPDQWDADPWLLNTPSGVCDLRTGIIREHSPDDYMTRITAVAPDGDCPEFQSFLQRTTNGDTDQINYLRRLAGYALTGSTREHVLAFIHGSGGNGKGVFIGAISGCMGDYHRAAPIDTFAASPTDRHPTELANLRGARLVTAQETEEGRRWAESRIKSLTGGDRISARFMRQDFFEFDPQFTLLIAGNHKPGLRSVDEAIRRRFHLIPFNVTIPRAERDERLSEKLGIEWPGILAWMIRGAMEWQQQGLAPPSSVLAATDAYLDAQDAFGAWLSERTERSDPDAWTSTTELYGSFRLWAVNAGEFILPRARFIDALETRGLQSARRDNQRGFAGVRLINTMFGLAPVNYGNQH